jgi:hypothetical protein
MPEITAKSVHTLDREVRDYLPGLAFERRADRVRVGHVWPADVASVDDLRQRDYDDYALSPWSRCYYETTLVKRETDDGETEYVIDLPAPADLFDWFEHARDAAPGDLPTEGIDARVRAGVFKRFHERIEQSKLRANRLANERYDALDPEWNPEGEYTTSDQTADVLEASANGRKSAHYEDFADVVGLRYSTLWNARHALVSGRFDVTEASGKLARATVGVEDDHQCVECDALLPPVELLEIKSHWYCDECAEQRQRPDLIAEARERRYDEFATDLDAEEYSEFGEQYHYSIRVWWHYPSDHSRNDEKQYFVSVEQGGVTASWFALERDYLVDKLAEQLERWSERRILAGRLVGPVPLAPETVHVEDETDADLSATDVIPQSSLGDFEEQDPTGTSMQ